MMPFARVALCLVATCATLPHCGKAVRTSTPLMQEQQGEFNSSLLEGTKYVFMDYFAHPGSFSTPRPVDGDISCGFRCSNNLGKLGGKKKNNEEDKLELSWTVKGNSRGKEIFGTHETGTTKTFSFNAGNNKVIQWEGRRSLPAGYWAAFFGGWSMEQVHAPDLLTELMVQGGILEENSEKQAKGAYRISRNDIGSSTEEVFGKMCSPGGADRTSQHKYAIPLAWDDEREDEWTGFSQGSSRDNILKRYSYHRFNAHEGIHQFLSKGDVRILSCADTSNTDPSRTDDSCLTEEKLNVLLEHAETDLKNDPTQIKGPKGEKNRKQIEELQAILKRPFREVLINSQTGKEESDWTKLTEDNVDDVLKWWRVTSSNTEGNEEEKMILGKFKPFQRGLLVLKYACWRGFMNAPTFKFYKILVYLTKN